MLDEGLMLLPLHHALGQQVLGRREHRGSEPHSWAPEYLRLALFRPQFVWRLLQFSLFSTFICTCQIHSHPGGKS